MEQTGNTEAQINDTKDKGRQPQVRLKGSGRRNKHMFCTTPELEQAFESIQEWYSKRLNGRAVSCSAIVRRAITVLEDHLKTIENKEDTDQEIIRFLLLVGSRGHSTIK